MHIRDARIDGKTGNIIIAGQITVSPAASPLPPIPKHEFISLEFTSFGFACYPVLQMTSLPSGFYEVQMGEPHVRGKSITRETFQFLGSNNKLRLQRREPRLGALQEKWALGFSIAEIDVTAALGREGMHLEIVGDLAQQIRDGRIGDSPPTDSRVIISGTVPWATMILSGVGPGGRYHQFIPRQNWSERAPVVFDDLDLAALTVLRSDRQFNHPLVPGHFVLAGPNGRVITAAGRVVSMSLNPGLLSFSDSDRAQLRPDGFCDSLGSKVWFSSKLLNQNSIELALAGRTSMSLSFNGDGLGHVSYETPYGGGHMDPFRSIKQQLARLLCDAELKHDRLSLRLSATLHPFDPVEFARHQKERNSTLVPYETAILTATLPSALLRLIRSPLADQQEKLRANKEH